MEDAIKKVLFNATVGKLVAAAAAIIIVLAISHFLQRSIGKYVADSDTRYRARKFVSLLGYLAAFLALTVVFSDRLGGFTVAFGVAGAGIAFDFPFLWDEIILPVKYGSDWKFARTMLGGLVDEVLVDYANQVKDSWQNMVRHYRVEDANVEPMITLQTTDNWIEFTVRYVVDYRKRRWMKDHLFTRILEEIDKSESRIRLASATFEVVRFHPRRSSFRRQRRCET